MNKAAFKTIAEKLPDTLFIDSIMEKVKEDIGKIIYEAKKECLQREPAEEDEARFSLLADGETTPKYAFAFDGKLIGHIEQKQFDSIDLVGDNYTIAIEFNPIR